MCENLRRMLNSQNIEDTQLAVGIIMGMLNKPDDEQTTTLKCIQEHLKWKIEFDAECPWNLRELEQRIYEFFNR